ncbi:hypothetical protein B0O80DRAFT_61938 [Mortierella sp. GBAus27b]|nr:hypothetical protein B0O80DRAFT_61938 [Mortierella sp. GBAus27b]
MSAATRAIRLVARLPPRHVSFSPAPLRASIHHHLGRSAAVITPRTQVRAAMTTFPQASRVYT